MINQPANSNQYIRHYATSKDKGQPVQSCSSIFCFVFVFKNYLLAFLTWREDLTPLKVCAYASKFAGLHVAFGVFSLKQSSNHLTWKLNFLDM